MNLKEAYSILELSETASPDEAKKRYRDLTKKFHPDINKEPGAEDKFKKINEAYQVVSSGKGTDREEPSWPTHNPFSGFGGFNPFNQNQHKIHQTNHIPLNTTISFAESVLGCKKDLKFSRNIKCIPCNGNGNSVINNGCDKCGGKGKITKQQGNMVIVRTCDKCYGKTQTQPCTSCNSKGTLPTDVSITVSIPGGIENANVLRINQMGNYVTTYGPLDQHTDAHLHVSVTPEAGLKLDGMDVVSELEISLLEAITGGSKSINTILGSKDINIKPMSNNKDEILIPQLGVNKIGNHKVILKTKYPEDIDSLVAHLSK